MAFRAGNRARKKESAQVQGGTTTSVEADLHNLVGNFTLDFRNSDIDKLYASILLYLVENKNEDDRVKEICKRLRRKDYYDVPKDEIENLKKTNIDINSYLLSLY